MRWPLALILLCTSAALGQQPAPARSRPAPVASEAEQIARLERGGRTDATRLESLKARQAKAESDYGQAEGEFQEVDARLAKCKKEQAVAPPAEQAACKAATAAAEATRKLANDRFDLSIQERKTLREEVDALTEKIRRDKKALDQLNGASPADPAPAAPGPAPAAVPVAAAPIASPAGPMLAAPAATPAAAVAVPAKPKAAEGRELTKAKAAEAVQAEAAKKATNAAKSIDERLEILDRDIALRQEHLKTARKKADNAKDAQTLFTQQFRTRSVADAPVEELTNLATQVAAAENRDAEARAQVRECHERLEEQNAERADLHGQQLAAKRQAEDQEKALATIQGRVRDLESPFAPRNLLLWLVEHGPRLLGIALGMLLFEWLSKVLSHRVVSLMIRGGYRGTVEERKARAQTLIGVFQNAATVSIVGGGSLMLLQEAGVPIAPLLGGAAVIGLAVAFGAQNLIRDYFYGFVILLENQYKIDDIVKIGALTGTVERITLRMTVLRDADGSVHFVPNGQVNSVTNLTHTWSKAIMEVGVPYTADVDAAMGAVVALGRDLRNDPSLGMSIVDDLTMMGVEALGESVVTIKFAVKTRAGKQHAVRRELLRRIKLRFEELEIGPPHPRRIVEGRAEAGASAEGPVPRTRLFAGYSNGSV